ncbi:hypothetical protein SLEP1_g23627 [Rubroshorea leprosula]|nr:hypothetical protein SLEP1_g23627 [Rubroshorea leprosula]
MFYVASIPGLIIGLGMQFAVDSPRWLCKVGSQNAAEEIIRKLWGESEVDKAIEEFKSVIKTDGSDLDSRWLELIEEPHSRGCMVSSRSPLGFNGPKRKKNPYY